MTMREELEKMIERLRVEEAELSEEIDRLDHNRKLRWQERRKTIIAIQEGTDALRKLNEEEQ